MKFRVFAFLGAILMAGSMSAQTLTDVINEFNTGVEKLNNQEYQVSVEHFNQVLALAETVGDEASDMRAQAERQIPSAYYRQATVYMKRKQYDNAIPYLEKTVESASSSGEDNKSSSWVVTPLTSSHSSILSISFSVSFILSEVTFSPPRYVEI